MLPCLDHSLQTLENRLLPFAFFAASRVKIPCPEKEKIGSREPAKAAKFLVLVGTLPHCSILVLTRLEDS
jgi:hypothetical protein